MPVNNSSVGQSEKEQLSASRFPPGVKWEDAHGYRGGHVHTCFPRLFFSPISILMERLTASSLSSLR